MPLLHTGHLGKIEYDADEVIHFPSGLPAFEEERQFLTLEIEGKAPLVFLQSVQTPGLAFITVPAHHIDASYRLEFPEDGPPLTAPLTVLIIVSVSPVGEVTANLLAPVVIDTTARRAAQLVMVGSNYPVQHRLPSLKASPSCL